MVTQEVVNLKDGNKICVIDDYIGKLIKNSKGYYEEEILVNFIDYIPFNGVIYDIGANIGNHTLFFSKYVKPTKIISFEPSKELFGILSKNIQLNEINNVQLINSAVGEKAEKGHLNFNTTNSGASNISLTENGDIEIIKIDDLELESPDFIKIDVEGFEYLALKGMEKVLIEKGPLLWVEIQQENLYQVDSFLNERGYSLIDRWLDNYIYIKPNENSDLVQIINRIKNKPFQRFNSKIMEINLKYRNITEQNKTFQNKIKMLEGQYIDEKNKNAKLNSEINELKLTIPHLKDQLEALKSIDTTARDQLMQNIEKNYQNDLKNHETKIIELNSEKKYLLNNIEDLKLRLEKSEEFSQNYFKEHVNLEILKSQSEFIQKENKILIKELEKVVDEKDQHIRELTHQNELLKNDAEKLKKDFLAKETILDQERTDMIVILEGTIKGLEMSVKEKEEYLTVLLSENNKKDQIITEQENNNMDSKVELVKNTETINMIRLENEKLIAENVDLKSQLENEIIEKIKLLNREELFALKIENELVLIKKSEKEKIALNNKISKLEKQIANITKKYNSLSNSKLGKITTKYWAMRKQMIRGK